MCGIAGIFNYRSGEAVDSTLLRGMTDILEHRGPDGSGFFLPEASAVGLGHRRLAILDLKTGDQPIHNEDKSVWVTFNGEIYNYRELRDDLKGQGHRFTTASDTEVLVHAYEEWGDAFPSRLNGIFAFAIWDLKRKRLFLARDHFGVKPLYYHDSGKSFRFASELKSILVDPAVSRDVDPDALNLCLTFRHTPSPWTLFKSIRKIPPASYLVVTGNGVQTGSYDTKPRVIDRGKTGQEWVEELRAEYQAAVRRQMMSDVPIGLSLSSGVDSTALLALMSEVSPHVHTFTVGFQGGTARDNEIPGSLRAAARFSAVADTGMIGERDYLEFMEKYLWHLEEPIGNESAAAYHFVARLAQGKVKVLLSGQGADEPFAGYGRHLAARYAHFPLSPPGLLISRILPKKIPISMGKETPERFLRFLKGRDRPGLLLSMYSITSEDQRRSLFCAHVLAQMNPTLPADIVASQFAAAPDGTLLEKMTFIDARTSLSDNLLLCGDKMAMAAGIEVRVPYLDRNVMRIAERIPGKMKVRGTRMKAIHKRACEQWLPKQEIYKRKIGFNNPMKLWLTGRLATELEELIAEPGSICSQYMDVKHVRSLVQRHREGKEDYQRLLFLLLSIETWNNVFRRGEMRGVR